ncbi:MAG: ankyrin repeat domain-containing protein [Candidatus Babeliales bacterium]|jgi:ankyrin repeat protein
MNALKKISFYFLRCALWSSLFLVNYQLQGMEQEAAAQENDTQLQARHKADLELIEVIERGYLNFCDLNLIKRLLLDGANIDAQDKYGRTTLMVAAGSSMFEIMRLLLNPSVVWYDTVAEQWVDAPLEVCELACDVAQQPADPNLKDNKNRTALLYALEVPWNDLDNDDYNFHYDAYVDSKREAAKLLIDAGADANVAPMWGDMLMFTPLIDAVRRSEKTIVALLLDAGANPFAEIDGQTARDIATQKENDEIISLLIEAETKWRKEHPDFYPTTEKYKSMGKH